MKIDETYTYIYPLTIIADRYNGTYSGGKFLAFNCDRDFIPTQIGGSDPEEMIFWGTPALRDTCGYIGKGDTPMEALTHLCEQIRRCTTPK